MKPEAKKTVIKEWMVVFGSFWAACLLVIITGLWIPHLAGLALSDRDVLFIILCAWSVIYLSHFAVVPILKLRRRH